MTKAASAVEERSRLAIGRSEISHQAINPSIFPLEQRSCGVNIIT